VCACVHALAPRGVPCLLGCSGMVPSCSAYKNSPLVQPHYQIWNRIGFSIGWNLDYQESVESVLSRQSSAVLDRSSICIRQQNCSVAIDHARATAMTTKIITKEHLRYHQHQPPTARRTATVDVNCMPAAESAAAVFRPLTTKPLLPAIDTMIQPAWNE
jgi:hypothetical protein